VTKEEVADGIILDYDKEVHMVGIEILDASKNRRAEFSSTSESGRGNCVVFPSSFSSAFAGFETERRISPKLTPPVSRN